ncbi:MAG: NADH-quinone oxidoreductase subunit M [Proteobacteria bacterium]|nr:NADH-quinone oxidoreductase subunit M [Pseudomonadota bacterium]
MNIPILSTMIFLPILGAFICTLVRKESSENSKRIAAFISCINSLLAAILWYSFEPHNLDFQFVEQYGWAKTVGINFVLGVDGISLFFVIMSTWLSTLMIFGTWYSVKERLREYTVCCLVLQSFMIGSFTAIDLLIFYVFFEAVLIPMFLIIGIWGGKNRIYATLKFFLYTLFGSVFMLLGILKIFSETQTSNFIDLQNMHITPHLQIFLFLSFIASFAIKIPMWPVHTWLPDAHVEAPSGGSVLLAGILLKMGGYGIIRFCLPLFPHATEMFAPFFAVVSVIAIIWTSLIALGQTDIKKIIAYSSIAHMGIVTLGIFTLKPDALIGSIFQMISHGLISAALFFCIGMLYDRFHTRDIEDYGGLVKIMPGFCIIFTILSFASIGLPLTSGFIGEILVLASSFSVRPVTTAFACIGMVLSAGYMLNLVSKIFYGKFSSKLGLDQRLDVNEYVQILGLKPFEKIVLTLLTGSIIFLGIYPSPILTPLRRTIRQTHESLSKVKMTRIENKVKLNYAR